MRTPPPVFVVGGPTASGKSAFAMALAERFDGVVINADSMQVYRDLAILTARPSAGDEARVPHRLFGLLDAADICSVARWRDLALAEIDAAHADGRRAIVVGGSGLYLRALMSGIAPVPPIPQAVRDAARARHVELGAMAFHAALAGRDPVMAARLAPGDRQRTIRAWEVIEATGRSLADWQAETAAAVPFVFDVVLLLPPRAALYAACDSRFAAMLDVGALDEVRALDARVANGEVAGAAQGVGRAGTAGLAPRHVRPRRRGRGGATGNAAVCQAPDDLVPSPGPGGSGGAGAAAAALRGEIFRR